MSTAGYAVSDASNGASGLRLAERDRPDVMLLDLNLPEASGLAVLRERKSAQHTRGIPVIIVSAWSRQLPEGDAQHASVIIQKPFFPAALVAEVERVLRSARLRNPGQLAGRQLEPTED